jgi:uncharacterized protein GlcG (DUF336 family)
MLAVVMAGAALTLQESVTLATAAIADCQARGYAVSASVVDDDGVPIVVLRGDGTTKPPSAATRKAATAVAFGVPGSVMEQRRKNDPQFAAELAAHGDLYNPDGGSLPLVRGGHIVGGIAVA